MNPIAVVPFSPTTWAMPLIASLWRAASNIMKEPEVQTLLEVFPADIRDVQEIEDGK